MRTHKEKANESFDFTFADGREATVEFVRTIEWHRELYGSDADGNRGMMMNMLDSDEATSVTVDFGDRKLIPLGELEERDREAVDAAIERHLEKHEFEADEGPSEPDPDRDDNY